MADKSMRYDHPQYTVRRCATIHCAAGTVELSAAKFIAFAAMKVTSIRSVVGVAGTHDDSQINVLNGTTSFATLGNGTAVAGAALTAINPDAADATLARGGYLDFQRSAAEGETMTCDAIVEYEVIPLSPVVIQA